MKKLVIKKLPIFVTSGLVAAALIATPVSANHNHHLAPVATFIALNWLFHHNHSSHNHGHGYSHSDRHNRHYKRRHSHSQGGYHRSKRRSYSH